MYAHQSCPCVEHVCNIVNVHMDTMYIMYTLLLCTQHDCICHITQIANEQIL